MSTDLNSSFTEQYMNINTKMKKRFMRKPNVSEATNEFIALAIQCEHSEQPTFAGHSYVGAAKCEASVGNFLGEAEHYISAARQFIKAEMKLKSMKFYSPERENLEAGIGCFLQALNKYPEKSPIRTSLLMELASNLSTLGHKAEAISYYQQALDTVVDYTMKLMALWNLMILQIDSEKFSMALETSNTICDSKLNIPEDLLTEVQVTRILLAILVKPADEDKPSSLKQVFFDLMNDIETEALPLSTDLRLKLQSITVSEQEGDMTSLVALLADTEEHLVPHQTQLLHHIISKQRLDHLGLT
ncbi:uncharacterized protein LOC101741560 [Bombyx mori]|uniref:Factor VIII intron 22 protein n=1 Tax=Bombyx mori TaxID=7091 RepID=A0A8R2ART1_BOMMO|nr:uncharacterized protein LOC101741560 [Bombyx mori]